MSLNDKEKNLETKVNIRGFYVVTVSELLFISYCLFPKPVSKIVLHILILSGDRRHVDRDLVGCLYPLKHVSPSMCAK